MHTVPLQMFNFKHRSAIIMVERENIMIIEEPRRLFITFFHDNTP